MRKVLAILAVALAAVSAHAVDGSAEFMERPGFPDYLALQYATTAELLTTNLAKGQIVVNEDDFSDVRVGDGETPGGISVGGTLVGENRLREWGGATAQEIKSFVAMSVAKQSGGGSLASVALPVKSLYVTGAYTLGAPNDVGAIGCDVDVAPSNIWITLTPQTNFQTVVIRQFGTANSTVVVGAATNTLSYDGQVLVLDYWTEKGNWYWRAQ